MPYPLLPLEELEKRQEQNGPGSVAIVELRKRRIRSGIKAAPFADRVGVSERHYRNIESGMKQPAPEVLARIATQLGCEPDELIVPVAA